MKHSHFPLFVDMRGKKVLVIGGGTIATRRVQTLVHFACHIKVISHMVTEDIKRLASQGEIELEIRDAKKEDLRETYLLLLCTDDRRLHEEFISHAKDEDVLVNVCDNREQCDFYFPAIGIEEELVLGLVGDGRNHKRVSRKIKELREALIGEMEEDGEN